MEEQPAIIDFITISGTYLGFSLGILLLFVKSKQAKSNIFLGLVVILFALYLVPTTLYRLGVLQDFPHFVRSNMASALLIGPLMWLYVRACTEKNFKFTPAMWLHFVPALLDIVYSIPIYSMSGAEKMELYHQIVNEGKLNNSPIILFGKAIHTTIYLALTIRAVYLYKKNVFNTASYIDVDLHRWLLLFCSFLSFPIVAILLFTFSGLTIVPISFIGIAIFSFINSVYVATFLKPQVFHALPHQIEKTTEAETAKQKYESSNLQDAQKNKLVEKLVAYVETQKPYQESELTLSELAEQVNIQPHYLSQIVNQNLKCTFLDFVNGYRVKEAKRLLKSDTHSHYTILAIAYEAGFNSKTAFYSAFKKHAGTTPSNYRKSAAVAA